MLSSDFPRAERRIFLKKDTRKLITCIAVPLATGVVSGFFTRNGMKVFAKLNKPPLSPPGWLFPVVWTILFIMMGIASFLIASRPKSRDRDRILALYGIQLAVNFLWPFFFFGAGWYGFAFLWLIFFVGTCVRLHPYIREIFPERCVPDDPISGMADFCRLPESVYRTLELTELLSHTENVFCFYKSG